MTLVDSSAWIELMRGTGSPTALQLKALLSSGDVIATTEPVSLELLAGARTTDERRRIRGMLATCRHIPLNGLRDWEDAAGLYVSCRQGGVTPRRLIDCLLATVAIRAEVPILARDRDFEAIAAHTSLQLAT